MNDDVLTVAQVSTILKVSQKTVRNWIKAGRLPVFRIGRRYRIRKKEIYGRFSAFKEYYE